MSSPYIEVDLAKIRHNAHTFVEQLSRRGINTTGVTKAICGHPAIAQVMLDAGVVGLAEARISNVKRLRHAGMTCPITLIRTPMLTQVDQVVEFCTASYNTQLIVIAALASAARRRNKVHGIILMVEMGDRREGIMPNDLASIAHQVKMMRGVTLLGIGANFACLSGIAPDTTKMAALSLLANETEQCNGVFLAHVSGGNSANLPWAFSDKTVGRINDLRLGEAILLGVDPLSGEPISGLFTDAFTLFAEVIETHPNAIIEGSDTDFFCDRHPCTSNQQNTKRLLLALGHQDIDILGLEMPHGNTFIGATSDHLVISQRAPALNVGASLAFQINYSALMRAMAAPDIEIRLLTDQPLSVPLRTPNMNQRKHVRSLHA